MTNCKTLIRQINNGEYDEIFTELYSKNDLKRVHERYTRAINGFTQRYGERDVTLFSAPGRTEVGGNHTDHQNGRVLAAAVNLDIIAVVSLSDDNIIRLKSQGHDEDIVDLNQSLQKVAKEKGRSVSLIRGMCSCFKMRDYNIGGFYAYTISDVLKGSGLSSSAAFEILTGTILNHLFNDGKISSVETAQIGQYAENEYYGKPSGLLDQTASAVGGFVTIDFKDPKNPIIEQIDFDFEQSEHSLCIVDCGGSHADLDEHYAAITTEMHDVAKQFGGNKLREVDGKDFDFTSKIANLRGNCNERAILRAAHFFNENNRVTEQVNALKSGDFKAFKKLIIESGDSSYKYLQNIYPSNQAENQSVSLALMVSEMILKDRGAWRVHGGGFGGTIQAFVPNDMLQEYKTVMQEIMGENSCHILKIRPFGGKRINKNA